MFCINCFHPKTQVTNSRPHKKTPSIWRRRTCEACGKSFTTRERPSLRDNQTVHLPSGGSEPVNPGKLLLSIAASFSHDKPAATYDSWWLTETVEELLATEVKTLTPDDIAAVTHAVLKRYDELAAVQYAAQQQLVTSVRKRGRPSLASLDRVTPRSPSQ